MFFAYIVTNKRNGTLYTGHTDDLSRRIFEHQEKAYPGFSARYGCNRLVWFETHESRDSAFKRELQIKELQRGWKIKRVVELNPNWEDLYPILTEDMVYNERRCYTPKTNQHSLTPLQNGVHCEGRDLVPVLRRDERRRGNGWAGVWGVVVVFYLDYP